MGSCCRNVEKKVTDGINYIFPWVVDFEAVLASVLVYLFFFPKSISSNWAKRTEMLMRCFIGGSREGKRII